MLVASWHHRSLARWAAPIGTSSTTVLVTLGAGERGVHSSRACWRINAWLRGGRGRTCEGFEGEGCWWWEWSSFFVLYVYALKNLSRFPLAEGSHSCLPSDRYLGSSSWQPATKSHFDRMVQSIHLTLIGWFKLYSNYSYSLWGSATKKWKKLEVKKRDLPVPPVLLKKPARFGSSFFCYVLAYCGHWRAVFLGFLAWKKCDLRMMDGCISRSNFWSSLDLLELSLKALGDTYFGSFSMVRLMINGFKRGWAKHQPWQFIWWIDHYPIWMFEASKQARAGWVVS